MDRTVRYLLLKEVAAECGVAVECVIRWIKWHGLRAIDVADRAGTKRPRWRVHPESLAKFKSSEHFKRYVSDYADRSVESRAARRADEWIGGGRKVEWTDDDKAVLRIFTSGNKDDGEELVL